MYIYWLCVNKITPGPGWESIAPAISGIEGFDCVRVLDRVFCIKTSVLRWGKLQEISERLLGKDNCWILIDPLGPDVKWENLLICDEDFRAFCRDENGRTALHPHES